eukprot:6471062-Amphidinium_carterae.1
MADGLRETRSIKTQLNLGLQGNSCRFRAKLRKQVSAIPKITYSEALAIASSALIAVATTGDILRSQGRLDEAAFVYSRAARNDVQTLFRRILAEIRSACECSFSKDQKQHRPQQTTSMEVFKSLDRVVSTVMLPAGGSKSYALLQIGRAGHSTWAALSSAFVT